MHSHHGRSLLQLGLTVLSGLLTVAIAPVAVAVPTDQLITHGDTSASGTQASHSEESEEESANAQEDAHTDASDTAERADASSHEESANGANASDTAERADASSHEESANGANAHVYTFPGTNGPTKIHILSTQGAADAILLESRGVFAMVDGGEGVGAPDGSDPRYPWRDGTEESDKGDTDWVLRYMRSHGVTSSNLAFYLGTHAHSDHIDNADDIIYAFHPQVILSPEYSDAWITDKSRLWDNQWCYDNMMAAARWAQGAYGASIVQHIHDYNTHITLGDMDVQIIPTDPAENYKRTGVRDANFIAYTAKVSAFGHSAYLAADLEAGGGYEDRIAPIVGHVDMLKAGHHGMATSNLPPFMKTLSPSMIVQTGPKWFAPDSLTDSVIHGDTSWAPTLDLWSAGSIPAVVATFSSSGISYNDLSSASWGHEYGGVTPRAWWFKGARPSATTGWWQGRSGSWYYFAGKPSAEASTWVYDRGSWYWMGPTGAMATSGWVNDGEGWYYVGASGRLAASGWMWDSGSWYYLNNGRMSAGWLLDRGTWYYMDPHTGAMRTGWVRVEDRWYYFGSSGAMSTGWLRDAGAWYYLNGSGQMATGWLSSGGAWYYLSDSGAMATGWVQVDGKWYYLRSSGALVTGWLNGGSAWYYLDGSGAMATGWILDHGAWYYLGDTGAMVTGTREVDGRSSTFASSGRWVGYAS